jgi:hypothetical protein
MKVFIKTEDKIIFLDVENNGIHFKDIKEKLIMDSGLDEKGNLYDNFFKKIDFIVEKSWIMKKLSNNII